MILRFTEADRWNLGQGVSTHLVEVTENGTVTRVIDLDQTGETVHASPSDDDTHPGDHAPFDMACDWSSNIFSESEFEQLWKRLEQNRNGRPRGATVSK